MAAVAVPSELRPAVLQQAAQRQASVKAPPDRGGLALAAEFVASHYTPAAGGTVYASRTRITPSVVGKVYSLQGRTLPDTCSWIQHTSHFKTKLEEPKITLLLALPDPPNGMEISVASRHTKSKASVNHNRRQRHEASERPSIVLPRRSETPEQATRQTEVSHAIAPPEQTFSVPDGFLDLACILAFLIIFVSS